MCDSLVSREGTPLGGREVFAAETEGWTGDGSKPFPCGQGTDCSRDSAPDKMPPLCSASCVFIRVTAGRHVTVFSQHMARCSQRPWSCMQTDLCRGPQCPHTLFVLCGLFLSAGRARNTDTLPALPAAGAAPGSLVPRSSIGLFMWEVTTRFATALQAAGFNVSFLLRVSKGHGTLGAGRHSRRPSKSLAPAFLSGGGH